MAYHPWPWEFFHPLRDKMACSRSGAIAVVPEFMDRMDNLRRALGVPIRINSWYRSPEHNADVSDTGLTGPHTTGRGVDIQVYGADVLELVLTAGGLGFTGFGLNQKGKHSDRFAHLDDLETEPRPWLWTY